MNHRKAIFTLALTFCIAVASHGHAQESEADTAVEPVHRREPGVFPRVGDYEVLRGDFHVHTLNSDGQQTSKQRVFEAWRHGYDAIAITDHGNYRAYEEAQPWAEAFGLVLLRGMETGIKDNEHVVTLGFVDTYTPRNPHNWAETPDADQAYYRDQFQELTGKGAVSLYAHPHVGLREPMEWAIDEGHIIGVEVKNAVVGSGWAAVESHGTWCYPFAFDWALEHGLALFANSDIHGDRGDAPQPVTLVLVSERTADGVMDAFRARRTVAWFDGMLWGREALLADVLGDLVSVTRVAEPGEAAGWVRLHNLGPVGLEARLPGADGAEATVTIAPYAEVLVAADAGDTLSIAWDNVYVTPEQTLVTEHAVTSP